MYSRARASLEGVDGETMLLDADGFSNVIRSATVDEAFSTRAAGIVTVKINDLIALRRAHGADAGRSAIAATASRMHRCTRGGDILARTAPDTFRIVVLDDSPSVAVEAVSNRAATLMSDTMWHNQQVIPVEFQVGTDVPASTAAALKLVEADRKRDLVAEHAAAVARRTAAHAEATRQLTLRTRMVPQAAIRVK